MTVKETSDWSFLKRIQSEPDWRHVFPGVQATVPDAQQERVEVIKSRLKVLIDSNSNPESINAAKEDLAYRDTLWLLGLLGENVDLSIDQSLYPCHCEWVDVGVGGRGVRVSEIPDCPEHQERIYAISAYGSPPPKVVLDEAEKALLYAHSAPGMNIDLLNLVRDLASHLRDTMIVRPDETVTQQFGIKVDDDEEICEIPSLDGCDLLAHGNHNVTVVTRRKSEVEVGYSKWTEYTGQ